MHTITMEARITGHVQGVAFRAWTRARAIALGLKGWVRNDSRGAVIATFKGEKDKVDTMLTELWSGPGAAAVTDVQSHPVDIGEPDGFQILR